MCKAPIDKEEEAGSDMYASLGLFEPGADGADPEPPSFEETAIAEVTTLRAVKGGSLTAGLSCEDVLKWWKKWVRTRFWPGWHAWFLGLLHRRQCLSVF